MDNLQPARAGSAPDPLLAALRAGDESAFESLVRTHGGRMLAVARRLLRDEDDARDAVQEAFAAAFRTIASFEGTSLIATWLHRIVVNACLMKLRSRKRRPEEPIDDLLPKFKEDGHQAEPSVAWAETAETLLQRREVCSLVRSCVDRLPETYRTVLVLRDLDELSTAEVAKLLDLSENAVKVRLHRARQALRALLDPQLRRTA
ncbi:MAG TPA: sigma-70 family RNA polymerase sigma factor [Thermoanaerobaculia bacterium]